MSESIDRNANRVAQDRSQLRADTTALDRAVTAKGWDSVGTQSDDTSTAAQRASAMQQAREQSRAQFNPAADAPGYEARRYAASTASPATTL